MNGKKQSLRTLYIIGAVSPLMTIVFYFVNLVFIPYSQYPSNVLEWFSLFNQSALKALFYLNSLDILSIAALGVMFIALYKKLKTQNESLMTIAVPLALIGVAVFIVPRASLMNIYSLSRQFLLTVSAEEQQQLLAAGRAINAIGLPTLHTAGYFFIAIGGFITSIVLIQSKTAKWAGWIGIIAFILTVIDDLSLVLIPEASTTLLIVSGAVWVVWWVMISVFLFKSASREKTNA